MYCFKMHLQLGEPVGQGHLGDQFTCHTVISHVGWVVHKMEHDYIDDQSWLHLTTDYCTNCTCNHYRWSHLCHQSLKLAASRSPGQLHKASAQQWDIGFLFGRKNLGYCGGKWGYAEPVEWYEMHQDGPAPVLCWPWTKKRFASSELAVDAILLLQLFAQDQTYDTY